MWNSEVGKRSVGISTFWFQSVCQNHIVWDAVEVTDFTRKHTGSVYEAIADIRRIIETLVKKRDERKDGFARVIRKAMDERLGSDADEVAKVLAKVGISRQLAKQGWRSPRKKAASRSLRSWTPSRGWRGSCPTAATAPRPTRKPAACWPWPHDVKNDAQTAPCFGRGHLAKTDDGERVLDKFSGTLFQ